MLEFIEELQKDLVEQKLSGWLLFDFRGSNPLARQLLAVDEEAHTTRRFLYWIPAKGEPVKVVHRIESHPLDHLPGKKIAYATWQEFARSLEKLFTPGDCIAMEYSPQNAIPYVSLVDGGLLDLVRSFDVEVKSSADLLQRYAAALSPEQIESHLQAVVILDGAVSSAWQMIKDSLRAKRRITELDVQRHLLELFAEKGCVTSSPPICAVNAHSSDPHYMPVEGSASPIGEGDFILIDLWCKLDEREAIYGDITRVGVAAREATERQNEIFAIVKEARDRATALVKERFSEKRRIEGWEVDQAARSTIAEKGYSDFFIHRTGHSIGKEPHGAGANMDNYETHDTREIIPFSCFSIEPGIYLPGEFGVRLEYDLLVDGEGTVLVTGGAQEGIVCLG